MRAGSAAGAGLINDVRALREPGALAVAAELGLPVCLMHMQGEPRTMQQRPATRMSCPRWRSFWPGESKQRGLPVFLTGTSCWIRGSDSARRWRITWPCWRAWIASRR